MLPQPSNARYPGPGQAPPRYGDWMVHPPTAPQRKAHTNNNRGGGAPVIHVHEGEISHGRSGLDDGSYNGKPQNSAPSYVQNPPTPAPDTTD
jgi:hypothetical protein